MQPQLCSRCKKNVAVVFITRMENGKNINEGLCLKCAKNLGLPQVNEMMQRMGITDEDLDNISNEMMSAFGGAENLEGIDAPDGDDEEDGKTATFPFLGRLFGGQNGDAPAPADGAADVEGYDARRKLVLSANLAFGASVREEEIPCFGISSVEEKDFAAWRELGRVCKLFVRAERHEGRISAFVCPTLFPAASPVAQTNGTGNLVTLRGARFGELSFSGAGAGGYPTGNSVLSDCVDVIEGCPSFYVSRHEAKHIDNSAAIGRFYLRTGSETVCTGPITVAEAFARAERARSCGEPVFLARIEEE